MAKIITADELRDSLTQSLQQFGTLNVPVLIKVDGVRYTVDEVSDWEWNDKLEFIELTVSENKI